MLSDVEEKSHRDSMNAKNNVLNDVLKVYLCDNLHKDDDDSRCKLGTGKVLCSSVVCEGICAKEQSISYELGTSGVECPNATRGDLVADVLILGKT